MTQVFYNSFKKTWEIVVTMPYGLVSRCGGFKTQKEAWDFISCLEKKEG